MVVGDPLSRTIATIDRLKDLQPNWDSYEAERIPLEALESAKDCVRRAASVDSSYASPIVCPTATPGISLIWRRRERGEVHALLSQSHELTYIVLAPDRSVVDTGQSDLWYFPANVLKRHLIL